jgi:hypothetical protein
MPVIRERICFRNPSAQQWTDPDRKWRPKRSLPFRNENNRFGGKIVPFREYGFCTSLYRNVFPHSGDLARTILAILYCGSATLYLSKRYAQ